MASPPEPLPVSAAELFAGTFGPGSRVYHVGFVVPDLEEGIATMTEVLGVPFTEPITMAGLRLMTPDGPRVEVLRLAYTTRPANVELIGTVSGTLWDFDDQHRGHHLGVWTDDVEAEAHRLEGLGLPALWWGEGAEGRWMFSYDLTPYGFYVELVDTVARSFYPEWFSAADPSLAPPDA